MFVNKGKDYEDEFSNILNKYQTKKLVDIEVSDEEFYNIVFKNKSKKSESKKEGMEFLQRYIIKNDEDIEDEIIYKIKTPIFFIFLNRFIVSSLICTIIIVILYSFIF